MRVDVDAWNAAHPVGTEMAVRVQAKGPWYLTKTTSAAWRVGIGGGRRWTWRRRSRRRVFQDQHEGCPKPATPRCPFCHSEAHTGEEHVNATCKRVEDWPKCKDVGLSSRAIYAHMTGRMQGLFGADVPLDRGDFGRCYRLLHAPWAQGWRERMPEMGRYGARWAALAANWLELELLYEVEHGKPKSMRLSHRITKLIAV